MNNSKKKLILPIIFIISIVVMVFCYKIYLNNAGKLKCERSNGDIAVFYFDSYGIEDYTINGKEVDATEKLKYTIESNLMHHIAFHSDDDAEVKIIKDYKEYVKEYEEKNNSVCDIK